jgi:RNA polymerase sigma factor (sigma-70 family)
MIAASIKKNDQYTDGEVIQKILSGETAMYEILIRRYNPFLYKIGITYGYNHHDTEDLMQETYISSYANLSDFMHLSSFSTWITRIMLNQCYHKKQKLSFKNETPVENDLTTKSTPMFHTNSNQEKSLITKELGSVIENALRKIHDDYRMVFTLRELNGLSVAETAECMNLTESNVKVRLNRAKTMLRSEIEKLYAPHEIFEFNLIYCDKMVNRVMAIIGKTNTI